MLQRLALAALLLPLTGCVVPPQPVGYGYGYPQPGYPGTDYAYPGYAYNDGSPTIAVEGATLPLIFYGGGWGYWDGYHRWHRAPEGLDRHLNQRFPGGAGYRPWGGGQIGRSEGFRPEGFREGSRVGGYPAGGSPGGFRPGGPFPGGGAPPGGNHGGNPWANHAGGPPAGGGFRPQGQPPVQRAAVPAAGRPSAPPPERHRQDDHH
jgi:hypothetical protein